MRERPLLTTSWIFLALGAFVETMAWRSLAQTRFVAGSFSSLTIWLRIVAGALVILSGLILSFVAKKGQQ